MTRAFRVGLTRDFLNLDGTLGFGDIGLELLNRNPAIQSEFLPDFGGELPPLVAQEFDALLVLAPKVTANTLSGGKRLTHIARFGVGYDSVDVPACTRHDVVLTITPSGVRRPVAGSVLCFMLALSHKLLIKDQITRTGRWHDKLQYMGMGLTGRTLGVIGLGNIGRDIFRLAAPHQMNFLASDPHRTPEDAADCGAELVSLNELLERSDFVVVSCALTADTRHLLNAQRIGRMKRGAYLINVARGPIVDQAALTQALHDGHLGGAGLDVFEKEPIDPNDPLLKMDNVVLAPHALCWTDEMFRGVGVAACQSILEVAAGRIPSDIVNREILERESFRQKLARYAH